MNSERIPSDVRAAVFDTYARIGGAATLQFETNLGTGTRFVEDDARVAAAVKQCAEATSGPIKCYIDAALHPQAREILFERLVVMNRIASQLFDE